MYYYQHSPTCFGAYYAIFRGNLKSVTKQCKSNFELMIKFSLKMAQ